MHPAVAPLLALVACLLALAASLGGAFKIREVHVVGANLPRDRIVAAARVTGQNVFTVRSDDVVARLSAVRTIVVTQVETSFPNSVTIHAQLRPALVAWQTSTGLYLLDMDGRVIDRVARTNLPVVVGGDTRGALSPGIVQAVRYAVTALAHVPRGAVATFRNDPSIGLTVDGRAGWHAIVGTGSPQMLVQRIAELAAFLQRTANGPRPFAFIDLRYREPYARATSP